MAIPEKYENVERWAFGDTEQQADELVKLVLDGVKTATCSIWMVKVFHSLAMSLWWWTARMSRCAPLS